MKLTERQCWKVIRDLVVEKNKEYSAFLLKIFDANQSKELQGYTRDEFLARFGFDNIGQFYEYAKERNNGKEPDNRWLENLSCEDLIIFLDFRCRILQDLYDYSKTSKLIGKNNIKAIVKSTKLSKLSNYNGARLRCGSKPKRVEGELKNRDLPYTPAQLKEIALLQTIGNMANKFVSYMQTSTEHAKYIVSHLHTDNITNTGECTGYRLKGEIEITAQAQPIAPTKEVKESKSKVDYNDGKMHFIGYDAHGSQIFILNSEQVDFFQNPIPDAELTYDANKKLIEDEIKYRFIGFDIQGTPVYEYGDEYYTSTGRRLDEDEQIYNNEEFDKYTF